MSNIGPLTTTFVPPPECTSSLEQVYFFTDKKGPWNAQGPIDLGSCFPPNYNAVPTEYYSPGLCPTGYTPACSSTKRLANSKIETAFTCCPDDYDYTCSYEGHPGWGGCYHNMRSTDAPLTSAHGINDGTTSRIPDITITSAGALNAQSIQVRFQNTDFSTDPTPQSSVPTRPQDTTGPSDPTASPNGGSGGTLHDGDDDSSGLSEGAKIGIGVGIAAAALLAAGLLIFFMKNRRSKARQQQPPSGTGFVGPLSHISGSGGGNDDDYNNEKIVGSYDPTKHGHHHHTPTATTSPSEIDSAARTEMSTERYYHEAAGRSIHSPYNGSPPAELDSSPQHPGRR